MYQLSKLTPIVSQVKMNTYISKKLFVSCSQDLEIFCLPAVPTEHLDGHRQPHFLMSLRSVLIYACPIKSSWIILIGIDGKKSLHNPYLGCLEHLFSSIVDHFRMQIYPQ